MDLEKKKERIHTNIPEELNMLTQENSIKPLSVREKVILTFAANGSNALLTANTLGISELTVSKHLSNARVKLDARNTTHAVAMAITHEIINPFKPLNG